MFILIALTDTSPQLDSQTRIMRYTKISISEKRSEMIILNCIGGLLLTDVAGKISMIGTGEGAIQGVG